MMSLFPRSYCAPAANAGLVPLFRFLNDFDTYSREVSNASPSSAARRHHNRRGARTQLTSFNPKFDVAETEHTYELHGELPGLSRENVDIQFTDLQTIVIRGRVERSYGSESEPNNNSNNNNTAAAAAEESNTTPTENSEAETEKPRRNSHQATVEDDPEDENWSPVSTPSETPRAEVAHPAVTETQVQQTQTQTEQQAQAQPQPQPQPQQRYWLWERSVGEFSRTFTFPGLVDHDGVTAALNNGILTVSVPKAKKPVAKRIQISA